MRVCIVSAVPEVLEGVLAQAGHEVKTCLSTDMAVAVAEKHSAEVVVFCEDVPEVGGVTREEALRGLKRHFRVVLVASRDNRLVGPAAGLGVRDFVFTPASPAEVLYRVEHEASPEDAAALLKGVSVAVPGISPEELAAMAGKKGGPEREPVWSKLFRSAVGRAARPSSGRVRQPEEDRAGKGGPAEQQEGRVLAVPRVSLPRLPRVSFRAVKLGAQDARVAGVEAERPGAPAALVTVKEEAEVSPPAEEARPARDLLEALVAVWSPSGFMVSFTALNLAVAAVRMGYDVALLNFNLACPETDFWFGVRQTEPAKCRMEDAGVMTFGPSMTAELVVKILEKRKKIWGVWYLPAGNKLRNIGTPDFSSEHVELFREIIAAAHSREAEGPKLTVVEAGSWFEQPPVMAALAACPVLVVPLTGGPHEKAVLDMQLEELGRLGVKPVVVEFYPLDVDGALWRAGKKPPALEGDISPWSVLIANIVENCRRKGR